MTSIPSATSVVMKVLNLTKSSFTKRTVESGEHTKTVTIHGKRSNVFKRTVVLKTADQSTRSPYLTDSQGNSVEGGALNANYRTVEAIAMICNHLGQLGLIYGEDFVWDGISNDEIKIRYLKNHDSLLDTIKWS